MNFKQKVGYMFIGCLFTLAGYFLASLGNHNQLPNAHAQQNQDVIDEIVCKKIRVVNDTGTTIAEIGVDTLGGNNAISLFNKEGEEVISLIALLGDTPGIITVNGAITVNGSISVENETGLPAAIINTTSSDGGRMMFFSKTMKPLVEIGAPDVRPNDGIINIFNAMGETRSFVK